MSVCCATLLLSQLVGSACVQARSSNPRGRACGPSGKGSGEEGILSGVVPVYPSTGHLGSIWTPLRFDGSLFLFTR